MSKPDGILVRPNNTRIAVEFDVVKIEMHCADEYEAQVLFDDLTDRIKDGQAITISKRRS